jgi:hypothetical protein
MKPHVEGEVRRLLEGHDDVVAEALEDEEVALLGELADVDHRLVHVADVGQPQLDALLLLEGDERGRRHLLHVLVERLPRAAHPALHRELATRLHDEADALLLAAGEEVGEEAADVGGQRVGGAGDGVHGLHLDERALDDRLDLLLEERVALPCGDAEGVHEPGLRGTQHLENGGRRGEGHRVAR